MTNSGFGGCFKQPKTTSRLSLPMCNFPGSRNRTRAPELRDLAQSRSEDQETRENRKEPWR